MKYQYPRGMFDKLASMAFKVRFADNALREYENGDAYDFLEGGVLEIRDKTQWTEYHAPGKWVQVTADRDHKPRLHGDIPQIY